MRDRCFTTNGTDVGFSDPQAVILTLILLFGFAIILLMGQVLTPVIAAITIAYVLEGVVKKFRAMKIPHVICSEPGSDRVCTAGINSAPGPDATDFINR